MTKRVEYYQKECGPTNRLNLLRATIAGAALGGVTFLSAYPLLKLIGVYKRVSLTQHALGSVDNMDTLLLSSGIGAIGGFASEFSNQMNKCNDSSSFDDATLANVLARTVDRCPTELVAAETLTLEGNVGTPHLQRRRV